MSAPSSPSPIEDGKVVDPALTTPSEPAVIPDVVHPLVDEAKDDFDVLKIDEPEHVEAKVFRAAPRIAVLGNVDSGKSTFVSTMTRNITDDGRGGARRFVCTHNHEESAGRTSAVSIFPIGFSKEGELVGVGVTSKPGEPSRATSILSRRDLWTRIGQRASKLAFLVDLCGHERYLKTTCKGLTSQDPHFACLIVAANEDAGRIVDSDIPRGMKRRGNAKSRNMTRQHLGIVTGLELPYFIVVTKIDLAPEQVYRTNMQRLGRMLRERSKGEPILVKDEEGAEAAARLIMSGQFMNVKNAKGKTRARRPVPVLPISSVTGQGRAALVRFLNTLETPAAPKPTGIKVDASILEPGKKPATDGDAAGAGGADESKEMDVVDLADWSARHLTTGLGPVIEEARVAEMGIDSIYLKIPGVALVVAGTVRNGVLAQHQELLMGPDSRGEFIPVTIRSIQVQYQETDMIIRGQTAGIALRVKKSADFTPKSGMYLLAPELGYKPTRFFLASMRILHHRSTIKRGYIMTINTGPICRAARVVKIRSHRTDPSTGAIDLASPDLPEIATGDHAVLALKFLVQGEILHVGDQILSREGDAKATGYVLHCFDTPADFQRYRDKSSVSEDLAKHETELADAEEIRRKRHIQGQKRTPVPPIAVLRTEGKGK